MKRRLTGTAIPLVTPLLAGGSVCEESVRRLIESVASSASALLPCLNSGEGRKLTRGQWEDMVVYSVRHSRGLPVFPGALVDSTTELMDRAAIAADAGAEGLTMAVPSLDEHGAKGVIDYFARLTQSLPLPVFIYNQESASAVELLVEVLTAICRMDRVVAIKESSRRPEVVAALQREKLPSAVFQGWEDLCYQSQGADGNALALSNLEPKLCADLYRAPTQDRQQWVVALCEKYKLFDDAWYLPIKNELWKRGILATNLVAA